MKNFFRHYALLRGFFGEVKSGNDVEIGALPDDAEQIEILIDTDMLPAVHDDSGAILTDEKGNIVLRY